MKNLFYTATFAAFFFGLATLNAGSADKISAGKIKRVAGQIETSKSNVSNNPAVMSDTLRDPDSDGDGVPTAAAKVNATAGEECDAGNSNSEDCKRDQASGLPTGRRMHKPSAAKAGCTIPPNCPIGSSIMDDCTCVPPGNAISSTASPGDTNPSSPTKRLLPTVNK